MNASNEEWYDKEVAPVLAKLAQACGDRGMSFCASVEYDPEHMGRGRTEFQQQTKPVLQVSIAQLLVHWAARCNGNVDRLFMTIENWTKDYPEHNSFYLRMLEEWRKDRNL